MKKNLTHSALLAIAILLVTSGILFSLPKTPPPAKTGAPGEGTCSDCHTGAGTNMGPGNVALSFSGANGQYKLDKFYTITVTVNDPDKIRFGFQTVTLDANNNYVGSLKVLDTLHTRTQKDNSTGRKYINNYSTDYSNIHVWTYKWKTVSNVGNVTFYGCGNATNGDDLSSGDNVYTTTMVVTPKPAREAEVVNGNNEVVKVFPNPVSGDHFTISFDQTDDEQMVMADLVSMNGQMIEPLFRAVKEAGHHDEMVYLRQPVSAGVYFVMLRSGERVRYQKVVVGL